MNQDSSIDRLLDELRGRVQKLQVGDRLPSSRELMAEFGVGPVTVQRAVGRLISEGLVATRPGSGTFVDRKRKTALGDTDWQHVALGPSQIDHGGVSLLFRLMNSDALQLGSGYLDASLRPDSRLTAAMARAVRRPNAWATPPPDGVLELRSWFGQELGVEAADVLICPGAQGALSATFRALVPYGSPVLFAVPTYPGALAVARNAGLVAVPVPTDEGGVKPELLEQAFDRTGASVLYLQPTYANPDGHVLESARRAEVLAIARRTGAFIVEDDWARWLGHGQAPPPPLIRDDEDGRVITINSLTKVAAPSLRIGAVSARGPIAQRIKSMRLVDDFFVSQPLQEAALELVVSAGWQAHLRALSAALRDRCATLTRSVARHLPNCSFVYPGGGLHLWLELPRGLDAETIAEGAALRGVAVMPGGFYTIGEGANPHLRLSYASIEASQIDEAVRRLAEVVGQ
jgi:DNA-binding transcriptional MocR family regulator